ncbi:hypothetical protein [Paenibacillus sp. An7]|uniref:hypothetical protein n=1 Tax=Paenibacillus sp. An7 TaxID=2689577 RepID=UPI00135B0ADC|nr:hypothetical protein [Paenibacillus sp. An7]
MNLLEWLLSNYYFVIVIGFALISFLNKANKPRGTDASRRPPSRESTLPEEPMDSRDGEYRNPYDTPATISESPYSTVEDYVSDEELSQHDVMEQQRRTFEIERLRLERIKDESEKAARVARRAAASRAQSSQKTNEQEKLFADPSDIRKGIIWAEVLGPPRAKRPYHSRNKY